VPAEEQETLSDTLKRQVLAKLEQLGRKAWQQQWIDFLAIPQQLRSSVRQPITPLEQREYVLRYLLLRALLDQQASADGARLLAKRLYEEFSNQLLTEPWEISLIKILEVYHKVNQKVKESDGRPIFRVGLLGAIKPISIFGYRFLAFTGFIKFLEENKQLIYNLILRKAKQPRDAHRYLSTHPILEIGWVGRDPKACRMYVDWLAYLMTEVWHEPVRYTMKDTLMLVNGHVAKVFARTGLLSKVIYEKRRPYIVQAQQLRRSIEQLIQQTDLVPFYVDFGTYVLAQTYCAEKEPKCSVCPLALECKKYKKWTAYEQSAK